jgi:tetratricopeptide (TPR) repeat protein
VLAALMLAMASGALAQKKAPVDPEAAAKDKEARDHYNKGILHYDLGEIDNAIAEFRQAYAISAAPGLLFNIAQAYRFKKDYEQALHFYSTYLRLQPNAVNRADVAARVQEMERLIKDQQQVSSERPHGIIPPGSRTAEDRPPPPSRANQAAPPQVDESLPTAAAPQAAPPTPEPPRERTRLFETTQGIAGVSVGGVGVLALITAAGLGGAALTAHNDYNRSCDANLCNQPLYDRAHRLAVGTDVLIGIGVAAAVTGVVLILTRPKHAARAGRPRALALAGAAW